MTWTGRTFSGTLTAAQLTNLQADILAKANGDTGAPKLVTAAIANDAFNAARIAAAAVGRSELSQAAATSAGTLATDTAVSITLNDYAFFPMIHSTPNEFVLVRSHDTDGGSGASPRFSLLNGPIASTDYDIDHLYLTTGV